MKEKIYIETSVISYLTSNLSNDLIIAGNQKATINWWSEKEKYDLLISDVILQEISKGNQIESKKRISIVKNLFVIPTTQDALKLANDFLTYCNFPEKSEIDALHIAIATINEVDILLTWNFKHLANPTIINKLQRFVRTTNYFLPIICSPIELLGE
jgi:hypothetical protein